MPEATANALLLEVDTTTTMTDVDLHLPVAGAQGDIESAHQVGDLLWTTTTAETTEDAHLQETTMGPLLGDMTWIHMVPVGHRPPIVATQNSTLETEIPTVAHAVRLAMHMVAGTEPMMTDDTSIAKSYVCPLFAAEDHFKSLLGAWWT